MPATITKAFIPRILGNVTISHIRDAFAAKQIGKVKNIDMHRRKNDKNNHYSFAFIDIVLYDTKEATDLCEDILDKGSSKVFYDKKNYWEVKAFLPRSERASATKDPEPEPEMVTQVKEYENIHNMSTESHLVTSDLAWLRMSMHSQLLHAHHIREIEKKTCGNCGDASKPDCARFIFWKNYSFCSDRCQWELESDIRKSWRQSQEPILPEIQFHMDESATSKLIEIFQRINDEAAAEMQSIRSLCYELIKRPSVFTKEDHEEMTRDYEALEKEIIA
uniref:RRM domain-containing protein n=1 Tax=viral metagenome TaxID=1070528 RepID=A0A6C0JZA7_9ZZZZ